MERINNRVDQSREAGSTSGSQQHTGWSYWRQYCKSLISGKPLDEEATKVSPQESEATPLLDAGQKRKRTDESSSEEAGQSREAGSTSGPKRPRGQSDSCQPFEAFGSENYLDEDNNDHFKFKYLTEEYEKLKNETLGAKNRYKELIENIRPFIADKYKEQTKKLISEIVANFEKRHLNVVDIIENLKNDLEKTFNKENKKLYEADKYIWKDEEIQNGLNDVKEMEVELKVLRENICVIDYCKILEAFINEQIQKSETIEHKYTELPKKEPDYANKPKYIKERVDKDEKEIFSRMRWRQWTDVEIQLERYKACIISKAVHRELSSKWEAIPYLREVPLEQAWRLCVDERYQKKDNPEFMVDKEPSYLAGAKRLLNVMLNELCIDDLNFDGHNPTKLTAKYYQQLHDIAVEETYKEVKEGAHKQEFELGYDHEMHTAFGLVLHRNLSYAGSEERWEKIDSRKGGPKVDPRYGEAGHPVGNCFDMNEVMPYARHTTKSMTREERLEVAETIIKQYHKEITSAKEQNDEDAKLTAIVRCCQDLYQAHLLPDGNTRTVVAGVLPKMLLENGFCPSILRDAKILGGFSVEEIKQAIREGQETFRKWCEQTRE